jgi:FkbM family methyltransferase
MAEYGWLTWNYGDYDPTRSGWKPEVLRKHGFEPNTLVDVGVGRGTPKLYEAFPDTYWVLIEPLVEYEPDLQRWLADHDGEYVLAALGDKDENTVIQIGAQDLQHSTIRGWRGNNRREDREIPVMRLDGIYRERDWRPPFGLKIDTEGYEDRVIQGAREFLEQTQFIIAEVNTEPRFRNSYSFADFIGLMDSHGFWLCDLIDGQKGVESSCLWYVDALFRRT